MGDLTRERRAALRAVAMRYAPKQSVNDFSDLLISHGEILALLDAADERDRLREEFLDCAMFDAKMEGPAFKGWNRSSLDRLRRELEAALYGRTR